MNKLTYYKPTEDNIFEERIRQYDALISTAVTLLNNMGYVVKGSVWVSTDPTHPTQCYQRVAEDLEKNEVTLSIPILDRNVAFISGGHRWIPVFQISDVPYFRKQADEIIFHNTYCTLQTDADIRYFRITKDKNKKWPVLLLMAQAEGSIETVLEKLCVEYEISSDEVVGNINIPVCEDTYINIVPDNRKLMRIFAPFRYASNALTEYTNKIQEYSTMEESINSLLNIWIDNNKLAQTVKTVQLKDYVMVPNGVFSDPFNIIDLLYYVLKSNENIEEREINDVSKRRVRLAEWMVSKLSNQHKNNVLKGNKNVFSDAIMDTINIDKRRVLDDSVNPLGELCIMSRIIYNGDGGISKESCSSLLRNLHDSYMCVIDPIDTPTGDSVGISQHIVPEVTLEKGILKPIDEEQNKED